MGFKMNQIVLFTDAHFGVKSFSKKFFANQIAFFKEQFFPYLLKNNIKEVIFLGDFIHDKEVIDNHINQVILEEIVDWFGKNNVNLWVILGNHDIYFKNIRDFNYIETIKDRKNIKYVKESQVIKINDISFGFVPFGLENKLPSEFECDVLLGHFDFIGFKLNRYNVSKKGLTPTLVNNYKLVLSGHYHNKSKNGNIQYLGSPYQMDWGDFGDSRGFYTLDKSLNLTFIENKISPKYLKVTYEQKHKQDDPSIIIDDGEKQDKLGFKEALELVRNQYVELQVFKYKNEVLYEQFKSELYNLQRIQNFQILDKYEKDILVAVEDYDKSNFELLQDYMNEIEYPDEIDKNAFVDLFNEYYNRGSALANG